jgi:integrase
MTSRRTSEQARATKANPGDGSWRRAESGKWELRIRYTDDDGNSRAKSFTGATMSDCRKRRNDFERALRAGVKPVTKVPTLAEWANAWARDVLPHVGLATNTQRQYDALLRCHVTGTPTARKRLTDLRPTELQSLVGNAPIGHASRRSLYAVLAKTLDAAVDDRLIESNPMRRAKRPRNTNGGRTAEGKALTDAEVLDLLTDAARSHRYAAVVPVALLTGMRRGELVGLTWDAVGFDTRTLRVRQQVTGVDNGPTKVKTTAGDRIIPMSDELVAVLAAHFELERTRLATLPAARPEYVFTNSDGGLIDPHNLSSWYRGVAQRAGLRAHGLHALRHTAVSRWIRAGVPVTHVTKWAGHGDPATTLKLYAWAIPGDEGHYANLVTLNPSHTASHTGPRTGTQRHAQTGMNHEETA